MALHPRQEIREAVKAVLVAANTAAGARVFESRGLPWGISELPAISVYSLDEPVDPRSKQTAPRELTRTLNLAVDAVVSTPANGNVDDALDALALQIETALHADPTLGGKASDLILTSTSLGTVEGGQRPMAAAQLAFAVDYVTAATEAALPDDLKTVDAKYDLSGAVHPDNQAEDTVEGLDL